MTPTVFSRLTVGKFNEKGASFTTDWAEPEGKRPHRRSGRRLRSGRDNLHRTAQFG
ncbi:hypothetical protein TRIP_B200482 [uncultured Desulfatiglans sp.]|uniref:Uncharacterized protein n=1 Tax=Uncultured Desulfatiglans sp. TaxID=1748965 RepID=A0A653A3W6_UNCDX|nr:hypothetical protein TRIP_B200482 [uncultured Desulfatiglans sp.]